MLGVARALMSDPRLLIVDELSLGLAPKIVAQLFDILTEVNAEGTSVLLVEQFVHMALEHTNRAYVLVKGEVALEGASRELLRLARADGGLPRRRGLGLTPVIGGRRPPLRSGIGRRVVLSAVWGRAAGR